MFTEDYPNKAPAVKFITKMFHPNIYADGSTSPTPQTLHPKSYTLNSNPKHYTLNANNPPPSTLNPKLQPLKNKGGI